MLGEEKIIVQDRGIDAGIAALMQNANKGNMDPAALMAMMNNNYGFGGNGAWWIWIIPLFFCWGGFGGNGFGRGASDASRLASELNTDANTNLLMQAINGNKEAISSLSNTLNCDFNSVTAALNNINSGVSKISCDVKLSGCEVINAITSGNAALASKLAECCCNTQRSIDSVNLNLTKMGYEDQLAMCNQTNTLVNTMNQNTLSLRDSNLANTQAILQKIDNFENIYRQDKMDRLTSENLALKGQISQANQNQYIAATVQANTAPTASADLPVTLKAEESTPAGTSMLRSALAEDVQAGDLKMTIRYMIYYNKCTKTYQLINSYPANIPTAAA